MTCRSTPGGKAVSGCATALGVPSRDIPELLHRLTREYREGHPQTAGQTADQTEVMNFLAHLAFQVRNAPGVSPVRVDRNVARVVRALTVADRGEGLPDEATFAAWQMLPSAWEAERTGSPAVSVPAGGQAGVPRPRPYHKRFTRFDDATVRATDALFAARPSQLSVEDRDVAFRGWVSTVSAVYGMDVPAFGWDDDADDAGGGYYRLADHSITMSPNHPSVTTLIHEFRHALQHAGKGAPMVSPDIEEDARAWSLSLYFRVRPRLFSRMVTEGRLLHIDPADLD